MSTHPPIPPNCPIFTYDDEGCLWDCEFPGRLFIGLDGVTDIARLFIASAARCAWLDEAERIRSTMTAGEEIEAKYTPMRRAEEYANAWAEWGREKA